MSEDPTAVQHALHRGEGAGGGGGGTGTDTRCLETSGLITERSTEEPPQHWALLQSEVPGAPPDPNYLQVGVSVGKIAPLHEFQTL